MTSDIKSMQLYPRPERILADLEALGYGDGAAPELDVLNRFDQLHYHGTEALDVAIERCHIGAGDQVLEIGSGWGGCARYIAHTAHAHVSAVELQEDYNHIGQDLTARTGLSVLVSHINADFLALDLPAAGFDHAVSWLALFHIPRRADYLAKIHNALRPGGHFFAEDLYLITPPPGAEQEEFQRHLFPNSLVPLDEYRNTLEAAGFDGIEVEDMTADWAEFTASRLTAFHQVRTDYERVHGPEGYAVIEAFYDKMAGYFARGIVGGLRFKAERPG